MLADSAKPHQRIIGDDDSTVLGLPQFLEQAQRGVPQALEAMFAPNADVDRIGFLRCSFRATGPEVFDRMRRTVRAFAFDSRGGLIRRRHALRLAFELADLKIKSRFDPALTAVNHEAVMNINEHTSDTQLAVAVNVAAGEQLLHSPQ